MKESLQKKISAITKKAQDRGNKAQVKTVGSSSLHHVLKTKAQADLFMKLLKEA